MTQNQRGVDWLALRACVSMARMKRLLDGELWGVAAFFDPLNAHRVLTNLETFSLRVRSQGLPLLIIELAHAASPYRVPESLADRVVRRRSDTVLWHKERLLNLGIRQLPPECRYVAWLDADIVFENDRWVSDTIERLQTHAVVQPFETACWLDEHGEIPSTRFPLGVGKGHELPGMAKALASAPDRRRALAYYVLHGHPGFAWAAHRDLIERRGLYDRAIVGGGDFISAHAFAGNDDFFRGLNLYSRLLAPRELSAVADWGSQVAAEVNRRMTWTPGRVRHLFHGPISERRYVERTRILRDADFDPDRDIALDAHGCWRWNSDKPELHARVYDYFLTRANTSSIDGLSESPPLAS